jgi:hypothetical protein
MLKGGFLGARPLINWRDIAVDNTEKASRHIICTLPSPRLYMCSRQRSAKIIVQDDRKN